MAPQPDRVVPRLRLDQYADQIGLDETGPATTSEPFSPEERQQAVDHLLTSLLKEGRFRTARFPEDYPGKRRLLRAVLNVRPPRPLNRDLEAALGRLLQAELQEKGIVAVDSLETVSSAFPGTAAPYADRLVLWHGDITRLQVDAIVNAANSQMLGCFEPLHACIDNAIHSAAGPQLRADCQTIMRIQGEPEQTGDAKITKAYCLPSRYVLHTVGPIIPAGTRVTHAQAEALAACNWSCLNLAGQVGSISSVAFPCIATGVYGFPKRQAAEIAVGTVQSWLDAHPNRFRRIVFNVFGNEDYDEYVRVFQRGS